LIGRDVAALKSVRDDLIQAGASRLRHGRRERWRTVAAAADHTDSWVNAGGSIYGRFDEVPLDEQKDLFDTHYGDWCAARQSPLPI
jgi:hypothetical protein